MRAFPLPIIHCYVWGSKRTLRKDNAFKFLSFWNPISSFSSASALGSELSVSEGSGDDNLPPACPKRASSEARDRNFYSFGRNERHFFYRWTSLNFRVQAILSNQRLDLGFPGAILVHLEDSEIAQILNYLYRESWDANVALCFFRWFEDHSRLKHGIQSVCTMICISILGNIRHVAMCLLRCLVRHNKGGGDDWCFVVFDALAENCTDRSILETVYSMLLSLYIQENMIDLALKLLCRMKVLNFFPSTGVCNSLIRALLDSKQLDLAWEVFEEMPCLNAPIISLFIRYYCAEGSLACACKLFVEIKNYGCELDVVAYTIMINGLSKRGFLKQATLLLYKMIQIGFSLDSVSVASVVNGYCKAGRFMEAMDVLKLSSSAPDVFVYASFISKLCNDGNMEEAFLLFNEMSELGMVPDCCSYTMIIGGYCKVRDMGRALKYFAEMLKKGLNQTVITYTILIDGFCKIGNVEAADQFFDVMRKEGLKPDVVSYNALIDGHSKKGHLCAAFKWLHMMTTANVSPDIVTYNILIHGLIKNGYVKESRELFDELVRRGFSPNEVTFTNFIDSFSKEENFQEAFLVWRLMSEKGVKPDVVTCSALLNGFCKARRMEEAHTLFSKMLDAGLVPDLMLYNTLVHGFCSVGNVQDACRMVNMMVEHGVIPNNITYSILTYGLEKIGVENAEEIALVKLHHILLKNGIKFCRSHYAATLGLADVSLQDKSGSRSCFTAA